MLLAGIRSRSSTPPTRHTRCIHSNYDYSDSKDFQMLIDFSSVFAAPYEVIEIDYDSYACVYSCTDTDKYKSEFGFVFSRTPQNSVYHVPHLFLHG
ncbi:crustacyanin-A2 subunit-like [Penaeus indicus]|uniref:crustacyanin-A2 subunit-like n=1 Tax=Penaeus indicus TaxID=29960 RepID=UPI00300CD1F7